MLDTVRLSEDQRLVRAGIRELCEDFDAAYWRERDAAGEYPHAFVDALADHGWLGARIPEEYGGADLSAPEVVVMMEEIAAAGGGFTAAQAIHGGIYNAVSLANHASESLKDEVLPAVAAGEASIQAFGLTEPNAGSDATAMETRAERDGDEYVVTGEKIWTSRLGVSDYLVLLARTTPREAVEKRTRGISMFLVDLDDARAQGAIATERIDKTVSEAVPASQVWFDGLRVPADYLIGAEGEGFYQVLDGLNEERLVIAAECVGLGRAALDRGVEYAGEREVFGRPIGANQAIQHPLAAAAADLLAAKEVVHASADALDDLPREEAGTRANAAKYLAAEAAFEAADAAVQTHGGFGVAREYDVERYLREARLTRIVPIAQELALNYLGEHALGLPRSY